VCVHTETNALQFKCFTPSTFKNKGILKKNKIICYKLIYEVTEIHFIFTGNQLTIKKRNDTV